MNHQPRKENHMNTVQKAILRACWQEEQCDTLAPRPWLRSPGSDVWVSFHDLPKVVCDRLWQRINAGDFDREDDLSWLL